MDLCNFRDINSTDLHRYKLHRSLFDENFMTVAFTQYVLEYIF